jgi:hypothetical protein
MTDTVPVDPNGQPCPSWYGPERGLEGIASDVEVSTDAKTPGGGVHRRLPAL